MQEYNPEQYGSMAGPEITAHINPVPLGELVSSSKPKDEVETEPHMNYSVPQTINRGPNRAQRRELARYFQRMSRRGPNFTPKTKKRK